jgi:iron complex outermembrane recepter protein
MFKKREISHAIFTVITAGAISGVVSAEEGLRLEEIVVTATKRAASMQDVPVAIQALNGETLGNQDINNFSDYVKQLPNVTFAGRGPGQNDVYIRGISTSKGSLFQAGGIGAGPTVAFYIDEAPLTASGRNLDVYITDMERLEVLAGPQGTLYGASSQAGTIRMITNKPDRSEFEANIELTLSDTQNGEASWGVEGAVNIPIIEDRLAVRIAAYDVNYGGYIDNVPGTISFAQGTQQVVRNGVANGAEFRVADNADQVEDDFNDSGYTGARISASLAINDDWDLLVGYMTQELEADGVFDYSPDVGDLEVQRFSPDRLEDEFEQFNWTLEGRMAGLDIIYTGSYLERDVEQRIDYVGYTLEGAFQPYYNCTYNNDGSAVALCAAPSQRYRGIAHSENSQHELRFSTDPDVALRFVGGVYYDESEGGVSQNWLYHSPEIDGLDFAPNAPHSEANKYFDPNTRDPEVAFFNDLVPESEQLAFFGELTYDFSDVWSATVGLRYYDIDLDVNGSFNFVSAGAVDGDGGGTLNDVGPENESDTIGKFTLNYTPNDEVLLYATYSEGFRRGGFNRGGDVIHRTTGELLYPGFFGSDTIDNYELGWKTTFMDGRLRFNGAAYYIDWTELQIDIFDQSISRLLFTANAGEAEIKGIEGDVSFLASESVTLSGAFSINDTELTNRPNGADNLVPVGSDLALTPTFQGNISARYDFDLAGWEAYAQLAVQYRGDVHTSVVVDADHDLDSYALADASVGVDLDDWRVKVFINNLTDKRAELFISDQDDISRTVTNRPRTLSLKVSYDF